MLRTELKASLVASQYGKHYIPGIRKTPLRQYLESPYSCSMRRVSKRSWVQKVILLQYSTARDACVQVTSGRHVSKKSFDSNSLPPVDDAGAHDAMEMETAGGWEGYIMRCHESGHRIGMRWRSLSWVWARRHLEKGEPWIYRNALSKYKYDIAVIKTRSGPAAQHNLYDYFIIENITSAKTNNDVV